VEGAADKELAELEALINQDVDFEGLCRGRGKQDDITALCLWISHKYNHPLYS
jgi:hypothetical protein